MKDYTLYEPIYIKCPELANPETERRPVVAGAAWAEGGSDGEGLLMGRDFPFGVMNMFLNYTCGDGYTTL